MDKISDETWLFAVRCISAFLGRDPTYNDIKEAVGNVSNELGLNQEQLLELRKDVHNHVIGVDISKQFSYENHEMTDLDIYRITDHLKKSSLEQRVESNGAEIAELWHVVNQLEDMIHDDS